MPKCGSQIVLCDLPVRFDTYEGCSHACRYCFASRKSDISNVKNGESVEALKKWIKGARSETTAVFDWDIPLHWGGMSDPFQPCERVKGNSLAALKVFADSGYPFAVSTKNALPAEGPYLDLSPLHYVDAFNTLRGFKYEDTFKENYKGITFHPRYEAKAFRWLQSHPLEGDTLFWITGGDLQ